MSRLIDADALFREMEKAQWYNNADRDEIAEELVLNAPTIEPEIIRCKDCKHWDGADTCDVIDAPVWDDDFCSMAERRTDG